MSKKVLIVEDVADIRLMMKIILESYGYQAMTADDGFEAIEKIKEFHPDLVLMDLKMPIMDGINATKFIREYEDDEVPIIALTAYPTSLQQKALKAGCNQVIPKPVNFDDFRFILNYYLS
jgi:CheY-like chemotaxis protein